MNVLYTLALNYSDHLCTVQTSKYLFHPPTSNHHQTCSFSISIFVFLLTTVSPLQYYHYLSLNQLEPILRPKYTQSNIFIVCSGCGSETEILAYLALTTLTHTHTYISRSPNQIHTAPTVCGTLLQYCTVQYRRIISEIIFHDLHQTKQTNSESMNESVRIVKKCKKSSSNNNDLYSTISENSASTLHPPSVGCNGVPRSQSAT